MKVALSLAIATLLTAVALGGTRLDFGSRPLVLRIQGHVGAARDGDRRIAELTLRRDREMITFQVDEIWVLSGDAMGLDVLHAVEPYTPSMSVSGPRSVVDKLANASPDEQIELTGYFRGGQRLLGLSSVEPVKKK